MEKLSREDIQKHVHALGKEQAWNHNIELPYQIQTRPGEQSSHGKNQVKFARIQPLLQELDLKGKRVLDVGCNEGFFSLQMAQMHAHVIGIDADPQRIQKAEFVKEALSAKNVEYKCIDIFSKDFESLPNFDFCLCAGFLHRIPDPFSALQKLSQKSKIILFEWKSLKHGPHHEPYAYFSDVIVTNCDLYSQPFWLISYACLEAMLRRLNFNYFYRIDDPSQRRSILLAGQENSPVFSKPQIVKFQSKIRIFLRHTKYYLRTIVQIISGKINA